MGRHTASHGLVSCHALEVHRRVLLSNDSDATDASYQDSANKATFEVSDGSRGGRGHSGFMSAYHNGTRPQVELTGDVTLSDGSTLTLPYGLYYKTSDGQPVAWTIAAQQATTAAQQAALDALMARVAALEAQ